jgi:hypothetical protein
MARDKARGKANLNFILKKVRSTEIEAQAGGKAGARLTTRRD